MKRRESHMLYRCITNINSKYIEEADQAMDQKNNREWRQKILLVVSVLLLLICAITFLKLMKPFDAAPPKRPLSVSVAELGKIEIQFGTTMPSFLVCGCRQGGYV